MNIPRSSLLILAYNKVTFLLCIPSYKKWYPRNPQPTTGKEEWREMRERKEKKHILSHERPKKKKAKQGFRRNIHPKKWDLIYLTAVSLDLENQLIYFHTSQQQHNLKRAT